MATKDPRIDAYIAKSAAFAKPILTYLRKQVHAACPQVEETWKWSFPHFMYKGMLCSMAAFKQHCAFGFWKGSLIFGKGRKTKEAMGQFGRITKLSDLPPQKTLAGYIRKAVELNDSGVKNPARKQKGTRRPLIIPSYLAAGLKKNKKAQAAFDGFTYSNRKEYIEWLTEAKTEATRMKRLATAIEWMAEGKSRNWKYAKC